LGNQGFTLTSGGES